MWDDLRKALSAPKILNIASLIGTHTNGSVMTFYFFNKLLLFKKNMMMGGQTMQEIDGE